MNYMRDQKGHSHGGDHYRDEEHQEAPIDSMEEGIIQYLSSMEPLGQPTRTPYLDVCSPAARIWSFA